MVDLFKPLVREDRLAVGFVALRDQPGFAPARTLMQEIARTYRDVDGNFVEQFQTTGFDARTWELFLYAFLRDAGAEIDWSWPQPDFLFDIEGIRVGIEAVTANPTQTGGTPNKSPAEVDPLEYQRHGHAIKLGSALYSKLQKQYWTLPQMERVPLILAIEDFHSPTALYHSSASLWQYLYGFVGSWYTDDEGMLHISEVPIEDHVVGEKFIPSGFFDLPGAEHVSAVLFGNSGTVPKFNRMGFMAGYGRDQSITMIRRGTSYRHDPNSALPDVFVYQVGDPDAPPESWGQGLSLYHNPNAVCPLPHDFLKVAYHYIENGTLRSFLPEFHPFGSQTVILTPKPAEEPGDTNTEAI